MAKDQRIGGQKTCENCGQSIIPGHEHICDPEIELTAKDQDAPIKPEYDQDVIQRNQGNSIRIAFHSDDIFIDQGSVNNVDLLIVISSMADYIEKVLVQQGRLKPKPDLESQLASTREKLAAGSEAIERALEGLRSIRDCPKQGCKACRIVAEDAIAEVTAALDRINQQERK